MTADAVRRRFPRFQPDEPAGYSLSPLTRTRTVAHPGSTQRAGQDVGLAQADETGGQAWEGYFGGWPPMVAEKGGVAWGGKGSMGGVQPHARSRASAPASADGLSTSLKKP
ncbi:MAG: hypothetical protein KIT83_13040 [Bryobacterales bacterium]|nr:hypothetical protein [Bryobacterales bacterium]